MLEGLDLFSQTSALGVVYFLVIGLMVSGFLNVVI